MLKTGGSILIVEDEPVTAMLIEDALDMAGYSVCGSVRTAAEAIRAADRLRPGLCVVDIDLADGSSGLDAAREMRERFGIPSILASAQVDARLAAEHGIHHWVRKPFTSEKLVETVSAALRK
jgi:DNA-binding response OmpR family regulator